MSEPTVDDLPAGPSRVRLEVAIAEMRGMLNTVVAQHNARLDENGRQLAEQKHAIGRLEIDVAQLKIGQAASAARDTRDDQTRGVALTRAQLAALWVTVIVMLAVGIGSIAAAWAWHR